MGMPERTLALLQIELEKLNGKRVLEARIHAVPEGLCFHIRCDDATTFVLQIEASPVQVLPPGNLLATSRRKN